MMKSMTGYGQGSAQLAEHSITVELFSVNRKSLELYCSLPREWQSMERILQEGVRKRIHRGKVNLNLRFSGSSEVEALPINKDAVLATLNALRTLSEEAGVPFAPDSGLMLRVVMALRGVSPELPQLDVFSEPILSALDQALDSFIAMRETEGEALAIDLEQRLNQILSWVKQIEVQAPSRPGIFKKQLLDRLELLGLSLDLSDERLLKEVALFADRCDVSEEIIRLESHLDQLHDCLRSEEPVGRKMDFLCQEVFRELNTIGSKANGLEITQHVIECKNELERIREQVQNIE